MKKYERLTELLLEAQDICEELDLVSVDVSITSDKPRVHLSSYEELEGQETPFTLDHDKVTKVYNGVEFFKLKEKVTAPTVTKEKIDN